MTKTPNNPTVVIKRREFDVTAEAREKGRLTSVGFHAFNLVLSVGIFLIAPILLAPLVVLFIVACTRMGRMDDGESHARPQKRAKAPAADNVTATAEEQGTFRVETLVLPQDAARSLDALERARAYRLN